MVKYFLFILILFYFYTKVSSMIYEVKSFSSLKKSLRLLDDDNSFLHEVKGNSNYLNYYYTTLYLGKDKMPQVYILDTGSSITTSPCDQCTSCGNHLNPKYKLENNSKIIPCHTTRCDMVSNSRCQDNKCSFHVSYAEGSRISGFYINEDVYFETIDNINNITNISYNIPIGCTTEETHLFTSQLADGIMGLNNNDRSFVSMLYKLKVIQNNIFSLCFSHEGGYFSIGKIATQHHLSKNISYVNILNRNYGNYFIHLNHITIGDSKIVFNGKAFIDSGTTLTYFPNNIFQQIMNNFFKICEKNKKCGNLRRIKELGYCSRIEYQNEMDEIIEEGWSTIIFVFDGEEYLLKPKNYYFIYNTDDEGLNICLGFEENNRNNILLGTTFMHGHDIIFDKMNYKMGFVEADCNRIQNNYENENEEKIKINDINSLDKIIGEESFDNTEIINQNNNGENNYTDIFNENNKIFTDSETEKNIIENKIIINTNEITEANKIIEINYINQTEKIIDIKLDNITVKENVSDLVNNMDINYDINNNANNIKISKDIITNNSTKQNINIEKVKNLQKNNILNNKINFDQLIIMFSMFFTFCVFIIFIVFYIILCRENYINIQNKKNDSGINQYELAIPTEEPNNPMSLFSDSI